MRSDEDRLARLRYSHQILARELGAAQRRVSERDREIRELRAALAAYRAVRAPSRALTSLSR